MKIQLTPWEVCEMPLAIATTKRRRKRSGSGEQDDAPRTRSLVVASFPYSSKRASKKARAHDDWQAEILMTFEHRIQALSTGSSASDSSSQLKPSSTHQYLSRPGQQTSFVSTNHPIPALLDTRNGHVYAFMDNNHRLIRWSTGSGPDEGVAVHFKSPAVSLDFLPPAMVCGSCEDGSVYVATVQDEGWIVEYVDISTSNDYHQHIATVFLPSPQASDNEVSVGNKRKSSRSQQSDSFVVYQLGWLANKLILNRRTVDLMGAKVKLPNDDNKTQTAVIPLFDERKSEVSHVSGVWLVAVNKDDASVVVSFVTQPVADSRKQSNGGTTHVETLCTTVSLQGGRLCTPVLHVAMAGSCSLGMVGPSLLATLVDGELRLVDLNRGVVLHRQSNDMLLSMDKNAEDLVMWTDQRSSRLWLVRRTNEHSVCVASAQVESTADSNLLQNRLSLADCLALATATSEPNTSHLTLSRNDGNDVAAALHSLDLALAEIDCGRYKKWRKSHLIEIFDESVAQLTSRCQNGSDVEPNPQDSVVSTLNGFQPGQGKESLLNGRVNGQRASADKKVLSLSELPRAFLEQSSCVLLDMLGRLPSGAPEIRDDVRRLLRRVAGTGKLSGRRVVGVRSLIQVLIDLDFEQAREPSVPYSAVDFSFDLCCRGAEVSETYLTSMLHYFIVSASADDVARRLVRDDYVQGAKVALAQEYLGGSPNKKSKLSARVILCGISTLMEQVIAYSDCNEALLRTAVTKILTNGELVVLCRVMLQLLTERSLDVHKRTRLVRWLAICSENIGVEDGLHAVADIKKAVSDEIVRMENLLTVQAAVNAMATERNGGVKDNTAADSVHTPPPDKEKRGQLPTYQIERLVF